VTNVTPSEIDKVSALVDTYTMPCETRREANEREVRMGNRANYGFRSGDNTLFLYGHWAGDPGMAERFATALSAAAPRFDDDSYATRITISQLIGDDWDKETGWGLFINELGDNENGVLVVDWDEKAVKLYVSGNINESADITWSLSQFVETYTTELAATREALKAVTA